MKRNGTSAEVMATKLGALQLEMVKLHVKRGDESQFLFEATTDAPLAQLVPHLVRLFNGRLKVDRLCQGLPEEAWCGVRLLEFHRLTPQR